MSVIQVKDKKFKTFIDEETILKRVKELAREIEQDYKDRNPFFVSILNGSFIFASDLMREIDIDCEISFVKVSSYRGDTSTGKVVSLIGFDADIEDRDVVILEDIVDSGATMVELYKLIKQYHPKSVALISLLVKPDALKHEVKIDYRGFEIANEFIVGYGLDYNGHGRNHRSIYQLAE